MNEGGAAGETEKVFRLENYTLTVSIQEENGTYVPKLWKIRRDWEEQTEIKDLWMGD